VSFVKFLDVDMLLQVLGNVSDIDYQAYIISF